MSEGYIRLHRSILEWEWYDDPNTFRLFIHLLLKVNHDPRMWHGMVIHRGECITSLGNLAAETGMSVRSVRTSLEHLKSTHEVTSTATNKWTLVKVENYSKYQADYPDTDKQTDKQPDKRPTTNKKNISLKEKENFTKEKEKGLTKPPIEQDFVDAFNAICPSLKRVTRLTDKRKAKINSRLKEFSPEEIRRAFENIERSDFASGRSGKWLCSFDWIIDSEAHMTKALEDVYANKEKLSELEKAHMDLQKEMDALERGALNERSDGLAE